MALFGSKKTDNKKTGVKTASSEQKAVSMQDLYKESAPTPRAKAVKAASGAKGSAKQAGTGASQAYRILVKPLITEKATNLNASDKYVFVVSPSANKISIAAAIFAIYGVKPRRVNLMNVLGKKVARGKVRGQRSNWRKAIVTLKKGEAIKVYEGV